MADKIFVNSSGALRGRYRHCRHCAIFFLPAFLCSARSARVRHLVLLYMNDFEILSLGCFLFFFLVFFSFVFVRVFYVLFACCHWAHFSFLFSRRFGFYVVFFCFFFVSVLLAHFLISHGSLANLAKTATENLIKPGISLINISASAWLTGWRRVEVQVTSGRMLSFG